MDLRNEAAHTHVDNVIGLEDFLAIAELIDVLCPALAQILSYEAVQRRWALGQLLVIGEVAHVYGSGLIAIVKMKPCRVAVGEEVLILRGTRVLGLATILTIQDHGRGVDEIEASMDQELGIELDRPCKRLNTIGRIGGQLRGSEELGLVPAKGSSAPQVISDSEEETEMGEEPPIGETDSDRSDD